MSVTSSRHTDSDALVGGMCLPCPRSRGCRERQLTGPPEPAFSPQLCCWAPKLTLIWNNSIYQPGEIFGYLLTKGSARADSDLPTFQFISGCQQHPPAPRVLRAHPSAAAQPRKAEPSQQLLERRQETEH